MCTVTILAAQDSNILITMNRDEDKLRTELEPKTYIAGELEILAPADAKSGGSWVGVNSNNIAACLLNRYDQPFDSSLKSRGGIVFETLSNGSFTEASAFVEAKLSAIEYNPFTLLVISANELLIAIWNGKDISVEKQSLQMPFMISSSSWEQEKVLKWRKDLFEEWRNKGTAFNNDIPTFHLLQPENWQEWSPLVERAAVNTRSITQIRIGMNSYSMDYWRDSYLLSHKLVA